MAGKGAKAEAVPQDQDLLGVTETPAESTEVTEPATPVEEPAAEKDSGEPTETPPAAAPVSDGRKELDRSADFGTITGSSNGACYVQDGIYFDGEGKELL
jgi:hypothetical protein